MAGATMVEDREPGAMELPDDEPFDVVQSNSSLEYGSSPSKKVTPQYSAAAKPINYDVGDLPTLSRGRSSTESPSSTVDVRAPYGGDKSQAVTGGRSSRVRPLSPPSRAGLDDPEVYQRNQELAKRREEEEDDPIADGRATPNMPMDERQSYEDEMKALALCDLGDGSQAVPEFCETALTAVNEMCGGIATDNTSPRRKQLSPSKLSPRTHRNLKLGDKHKSSAGVEEQTAIEVEYVEPLYRGKYGNENDAYASPKRKNALLRAMTRKAKDDYTQRSGSTPKKRGKNKEVVEDDPTPETRPTDNVYATFSNAEKRKFLQLINGGNTPFEATSKVLKERMENGEAGSVADSSVNDSVQTPGTNKTPPRSSSKGGGRSKPRMLSFWKRGGKPRDGVDSNNTSNVTSAPNTPKSTYSARSGITNPSPKSVAYSAKSGVSAGEENEQEIYEDNDDNSAASSCEKVGEEIKKFLQEDAAMSPVPGRIVTMPSRDEEEEDEPRFERSGINYYDAVRRDRSMEEEDDYYNDGEYPEDTKSSTRRTRKLKIPRGIKGFSKLRNRGNPVPDTSRDEIEELEKTLSQDEEAPPAQAEEQEPPVTETAAKEEPEVAPESAPAVEEAPLSPEKEVPAVSSYDEEKKAEDAMDAETGDALEDAMAAKLLGNIPPQMPDVEDTAVEETPANQPRHPLYSPEEIVDDLNMDAYLNATETMSRGGGNNGNSSSFDATSVVSGRSYKTSGTTYSTRSRRPGQAKVRLANEKNMLNTSVDSNKTHGWQESIEAVAQKTGKIWDPNLGWKDYIDPNKLETPASNDNLNVESVETMGVDRDTYREVAPASDPTKLAEWKTLARTPPRSAAASKDTSNRKSKSPGRSRRSPKKPPQSPKQDDTPRGWAATMKAATAKLNLQGKNWDPEKGWSGLSEEEAQSVTGTQRLDQKDVAVTADSDLQDFGTLSSAVDKLAAIADQRDQSIQFLSEDEEAEVNQTGEEMSTDGQSANKYMQIAETGSVREYQRHKAPKTTTVNVRKQNITRDDANFFEEGSRHNKGPVDLDDLYEREDYAFPPNSKVVKGPNANAVYQKIYESQSNESFEVNTDFSFDNDEATEAMDNTLDHRNPVPRLKINIRDRPGSTRSAKAQSEASFGSDTSIPKLAAPKRDTSPIRANKPRRSGDTPPRPSPPPKEQYPSPEDQSPARETIHTSDDRAEDVANLVEKITPDASSNPKSSMPPKVSELHKMWEKRSAKSYDEDGKELLTEESLAERTENSEWKSYLVKKVQGESSSPHQDRDSVFDFEDGEGNTRRRRNKGEPEDGFDDISELSPIRHHHDESDSEFGASHSEASTSVLQGTTFVQRLKACAAPIMQKGSQIAQNQNCNAEGPIAAHLAFLRNNPQVSGSPSRKGSVSQAAAGLCGRPDVIAEETDDETSYDDKSRTRSKSQDPKKSNSSGRSDKERRAKSTPRSRQHNKDDLSSVISEGFGAKSAYLEAIAMKAAVGSKKKKKRSPGSDVSGSTAPSQLQPPGSDASATTGTSRHSEKFQQFLDRRASKAEQQEQLPDRKPPTGRADVSSRAEKYASEKVNEMMDSMAGRKNQDHRGRAKEDYEETGAFPTLPGSTPSPTNDASRLAAEELAAARVEVMMQRLSSQAIEDNEAEI